MMIACAKGGRRLCSRAGPYLLCRGRGQLYIPFDVLPQIVWVGGSCTKTPPLGCCVGMQQSLYVSSGACIQRFGWAGRNRDMTIPQEQSAVYWPGLLSPRVVCVLLGAVPTVRLYILSMCLYNCVGGDGAEPGDGSHLSTSPGRAAGASRGVGAAAAGESLAMLYVHRVSSAASCLPG
jgi:hypothetical protein